MSSSEFSSRAAPTIDLQLRPGNYQIVDWIQGDGNVTECVLMFTAGYGLILASPQGEVKKVTSAEDIIGAVILTKTEPPTVVLQCIAYNINLLIKSDRRNKNNESSRLIAHINAVRERAGRHSLVAEVCSKKGTTHAGVVQFKHPVINEQRMIEEYILPIGTSEIGLASREIDGFLQIYNTTPGSAAEKANVKPGSTLISIGGVVLDPNNGPLRDQVTGVIESARRDNVKSLQITARVPVSTVAGAEPVTYSDPRVPILCPLVSGTKALVVFVYEEGQLTHPPAITRIFEGLRSLYRKDKVRFLTNSTPYCSSRTNKVLRHGKSTEKEIHEGIEWLVQDCKEESLLLLLITPSKNGDSIVTADRKTISATEIIDSFVDIPDRSSVTILVDTRPSNCFGFRFQDKNNRPPPDIKAPISIIGIDTDSISSDPGMLSQCFVTAHLRNIRSETVNFIRACLPADSRIVWTCNQKFNSTFTEGMPVKSASGWWKSQIPAIIWRDEDFMVWVARFYRWYNQASVRKASSIAHENRGREHVCVQALMEKYLTSGVGLAISEAVSLLGEALKYSPVDREQVFSILQKINRQEIWREASNVYRDSNGESLKKSLKHNMGKLDYEQAKRILRNNKVSIASSSGSDRSNSSKSSSKSETINTETRKKVRSSFASSSQPVLVPKKDRHRSSFTSTSSLTSTSDDSSHNPLKVSRKSSKASKNTSFSKISKNSKSSKATTKKSAKTHKSEDAPSKVSRKSKSTTRRSNSSANSMSSSRTSSISSSSSSSSSSSEEVKKVLPSRSSLKSSRTPESSMTGPPHYGESHPVPPPVFTSARSPYQTKNYSTSQSPQRNNYSPNPKADSYAPQWRHNTRSQQHSPGQQATLQRQWSPPAQPSLRDIVCFVFML